MNPMDMMHVAGALNTFKQEHPKFAQFVKNMTEPGTVTEGTVIEITLKQPDGTAVTGNMRVKPSDIELFQSLKNLRN